MIENPSRLRSLAEGAWVSVSVQHTGTFVFTWMTGSQEVVFALKARA